MKSKNVKVDTSIRGARQSPYGSWKSPFTSDLIVADSITLTDILCDGSDIYWIEGRPEEAGRYVVVKRSSDGTIEDVTPSLFNARTRVHEYGGGAVAVKDEVVFFTNFADQKLYRQDLHAFPIVISQGDQCRYADGVVDSLRNRLVCVREDHSSKGGMVVNSIVDVASDGMRDERVLLSGNDFYSNPRISPDGTVLAWLTWNHPSMPWIGTELWIADINESGLIGAAHKIAGSSEESIFQPEWSPNGVLYFVSDKTGWWNLYRYKNDSIDPLMPLKAEFGQAQWFFGMTTYGFISGDQILCSYQQEGNTHLGILDPETASFNPIHIPYTEISSVRVSSEAFVLRVGSPDKPVSIIKIDFTSGHIETLRRSTNLIESSEMRAYVSMPKILEFPTGDKSAFALFYPPYNPDFMSSDELPPLIVKSHGGPTAAASSTLDLRIQYWTSRGFAVVDVDYGGSTGYGREFRDRLKNNWGIVDLEDCIAAAKFLIESNKVDPKRIGITGGSAGGYTTLCALTFRDFFHIGATYYGIGDLEALARDTHKFESHYMEWLVGKYPEEIEVYKKRSPINFTDQISVPVVIFQGSEDQIVPQNQAEMMVQSIRKKGLPLGYFLFDGEQHGFRRAENIKRALDAELYFYSYLLIRSGLTF